MNAPAVLEQPEGFLEGEQEFNFPDSCSTLWLQNIAWQTRCSHNLCQAVHHATTRCQ